MSPEAAYGLPLDPRSDIYSLGATFYHALAGVPPFTGQTAMALLYRHINDPPRALDAVNPRVDPELAHLLKDAGQGPRRAIPDLRSGARGIGRDPGCNVAGRRRLRSRSRDDGPGNLYSTPSLEVRAPLGLRGNAVVYSGGPTREVTPVRSRKRPILAAALLILLAGVALGWMGAARPFLEALAPILARLTGDGAGGDAPATAQPGVIPETESPARRGAGDQQTPRSPADGAASASGSQAVTSPGLAFDGARAAAGPSATPAAESIAMLPEAPSEAEPSPPQIVGAGDEASSPAVSEPNAAANPGVETAAGTVGDSVPEQESDADTKDTDASGEADAAADEGSSDVSAASPSETAESHVSESAAPAETPPAAADPLSPEPEADATALAVDPDVLAVEAKDLLEQFSATSDAETQETLATRIADLARRAGSERGRRILQRLAYLRFVRAREKVRAALAHGRYAEARAALKVFRDRAPAADWNSELRLLHQGVVVQIAEAELRSSVVTFFDLVKREQWDKAAYAFPAKRCRFPSHPNPKKVIKAVCKVLQVPAEGKVLSFQIQGLKVDPEGLKGWIKVSLALAGDSEPHVQSVLWARNCGKWRLETDPLDHGILGLDF